MNKETTKMIPGDELHLTMLMAPYNLNQVTGQDRQDLLAFGRAAFEAGKADRSAQCLHQIAEPAAALTEQDAALLNQGIELLLAISNDERNSGNCSAAEGATASAYAVQRMAAALLTTQHAAPLAAVHPDDAAVDALAALMKAKLAEKRAKGYGGWNDKTQCPQQRLSDMLRAHVDKGDPVDVANFCAMLSARGDGIAAAPQAVQAAEPEGWKLAPIKVPDSAFAWVSGGYPAGYKAGDKRDTAVVHERAQRTWEAILNGITAPAHPAEGVQAQTMQASEGIEDVAVMEHPEWMLVHKETGAQKPLDSQWTVRATQPATQGMEAHEFVLGVAGLLPDPRDAEFFRWLTGDHESAETRIACASLIGRMSVMSTSAVRADIANAIAAQAKQGGAA